MGQPVYVLGISAYSRDSAACLLRDGEIVAALAEERLSRRKHDPGFPARAARVCLDLARIPAARLDAVAFYDKPDQRRRRILETHLACAPGGLRAFVGSFPRWFTGEAAVCETVRRALGYSGPVLFADHHLSQAAGAFYPSPFRQAAVLTVGWATSTIGAGRDSDLELLSEQRYPHSLGFLHSAFTAYCGFTPHSEEHKLPALAPHGEPRFVEAILREVIDLKADGSFRLRPRSFDFAGGLPRASRRLRRFFEGPPRPPESVITEREKDLARSLQVVAEEILLCMARTAFEKTRLPWLALSGEAALNPTANARLVREGPFREVWIQPAAGEEGGALGAALAVGHGYFSRPRPTDGKCDAMKGALLGPAYSDTEIAQFLEVSGAEARRLGGIELLTEVAERLARGELVGWFQGPLEFGARALGGRSILGDPRNPKLRSRMNLGVKFRESFRPFAAAVLEERCADRFELDRPSPYLLLSAPVRGARPAAPDGAREGRRSPERPGGSPDLPAVTAADGSARIQTVGRAAAPLFRELLLEFEERTACPVLANASLRAGGEPLAASPADAYRFFLSSGLEVLVLGSYLLTREKQRRPVEVVQRRREFVLD